MKVQGHLMQMRFIEIQQFIFFKVEYFPNRIVYVPSQPETAPGVPDQWWNLHINILTRTCVIFLIERTMFLHFELQHFLSFFVNLPIN